MAKNDESKGKRRNELHKEGERSVQTGVAGCEGFAVVNSEGELKGCYASRADAEAAITAEQNDNNDGEDMHMAQKYSEADIRVMSKRDQAMPSGAFPILDEEDLRFAVREFSKAQGHPRSAAMNHIMRRAVTLGLKDLLPVEWGINKSVTLAEEEAVRKTHAAGVASLQKNATGTIISSSAIDSPLSI